MVKLRTLNDNELVIKVSNSYSNAVLFNEKNFQRNQDGWRFYSGIDAEKGLGQYPSQVVQSMIQEGRHIATYNFCEPIVDNIAGGMMKTPLTTVYSPVNGNETSLTERLKDLHTVDKELEDWDVAKHDLIIGGLIHRADAEMYIDYSYDKKFGNIGMRVRSPGTVVYDPNWKSRRSKDCRVCWVSSWLTPMEMLDIYPNNAEGIDMAAFFKKHGKGAQSISAYAQIQNQYGDTYGDNTGPNPYPWSIYSDVWGSKFRVIQQYEMVRTRIKNEFVLTIGPEGKPIKVPIPAELKHVNEKIEFLNKFVPDWQPDAVFEDEDWEDVQIMSSICPSLSPTLILDRKPTKIQSGRIQFHPWSCTRNNGESKGIIDNIKDAQMQINYWESMLTYKIQIEGGGGSRFIDPGGFANPQEMQKFIKHRNNPRMTFKTKNGYLLNNAEGPSRPVRNSGFPSEVTSHLQHIIDVLLPRISKVTPASQGRSESNKESGYLYRLKKLQSDIQQHTMYESLRLWENEWGEAYMIQAPQTYGNKIPREIYNPKTKQSVTINKEEVRDGMRVIVDDVSMLKSLRHKVTVMEADDAPTRKVETMIVATEAMKVMPQSKPLTINKLGQQIAMSIEAFSADDKQELERFGELELEVAEAQMRATLANLQYTELAAKAQTQQLQQKMGMQPGQEQAQVPGQEQGALPAPEGAEEAGVEPMFPPDGGGQAPRKGLFQGVPTESFQEG